MTPLSVTIGLPSGVLDVTDRVRMATPVETTRGREEFGRESDPASGTLTVDNGDGFFSPLNPESPLYGAVGRNALWTVTYSDVPLDVLTGHVYTWPVRWDASDTDRFATLTVQGMRRRMWQGRPALQSPMRRWFGTPRGVRTSYWPLQETGGAEWFAPSGGGGVPHGSHTGDIEPGGFDGFPASDVGALVGQDFGTISFRPVWGDDPGWWSVGMLVYMPPDPPEGESPGYILMAVHADNATLQENFMFGVRQEGTEPGLKFGYDSATTIVNFTTPVFDHVCYVVMGMSAVSERYEVRLYRLNPDGTVTTEVHADSRVDVSSEPPTVNVFKPNEFNDATLIDFGVAHVVAVHTDPSFFDIMPDLLPAFRSETAGRRLLRLADEESVPVDVVGDPDDTEAMGAQDRGTLRDLMLQCEAADGGLLDDGAGDGITYRTRRDFMAAPVVATLDYSDLVFREMPEPVDDDLLLRNDVTINIPSGDSARARRLDGPRSVQLPPDGVGEYAETLQVNLDHVGQAERQASWRTQFGTVAEPRFPSLVLGDLTTDAAVWPTVVALQPGDKIRLVGMPQHAVPDGRTLLVSGVSHMSTGTEWRVTLRCVDGSLFAAHEYADGGSFDTATAARYDSDRSSLGEPVDMTQTQFQVFGPLGQREWITDADYADQFPFDVDVGGERMTVSSIVEDVGAYLFTVVRSVNGVQKTHTDGQRVRLFDPARYQW